MVPVKQGEAGVDPWVTSAYGRADDSLAKATSDITGTAVTEIIAAQGTGTRIYVTHLLVQNSHATVSTWVNIKDGSGAILETVYAPATGGGASCTYPKPLRCSPGSNLTATCETSGANVRVSASGYRGI